MKGLRCTTSNCEHNRKNHCMAGVINVTGRANCATRMKREGGVLAQVFTDFEAAPDMDTLAESDTMVQCDASCIYNAGGICGREHLHVGDGAFATKCFDREK